MVAQGIAPEDYQAYRAGAMVGYDGDGNWIPGPHFDAWVETEAEAEGIELVDA